MKRSFAIEVIVFLYTFLFVYAALMKLMDYEKFVVQLNQSPLLMAFSGWIAWAIPAAELIIAALLLIMRARVVALYAAFTLMVMFTVYIIIILNFAPQVPCSCGGILNSMGWWEHLVFNIAFLVISVIGIVLTESTIYPVDKPEMIDPKVATL